jgi:RHS repeat-associated protein
MPSSGYLYIYVSNETPNISVFFDNLQVSHVHGPMLEETHYYPFGLTMAGISSKVLNGEVENKKKYNGIDWENDFDLAIYDAFYRELDPQTGRWWQIDPVTNGYEEFSPYASNYNNPIKFSDPLGDEGTEGGGGCCDFLKDAANFIAGTAVGTTFGVVDNLTGTNTREMLAPIFKGTGAAGHGYNTGLGIADAGSFVIGMYEVASGGAGLMGSGVLALGSGGTLASAAAVTATGSLALGVHGLGVMANSVDNLANQRGRVDASSNSSGKGSRIPKVRESIETGKRAHSDFSKKSREKGWLVSPHLVDPKTGKTVIPDAFIPGLGPLELKPNTTSGRAKGKSQLPQYERATGLKGKVITYDPKKYKK